MIVCVILCRERPSYPNNPNVHKWGLVEAYYLSDAKRIAERHWKEYLDEDTENTRVRALTLEEGFDLLYMADSYYPDFDRSMPRQ